MNLYLNKIKNAIDNLDPAATKALSEISFSQTYAKGDFLLKAGAVSTKSYWVESGILRKFYLHNNKEITTEFFFTDDLALSFSSYTLQAPGKEYIQALTDVTVNVTDYACFQEIRSKHRDLLELDFIMTEYYALWLEEKVFELHTQNATERYHSLIKKSPRIIQQVPLNQIATYLNISLETLSRIRAKNNYLILGQIPGESVS